MALGAVAKERSVAADGRISETECIVGVSRYITNPDQASCEFSLLVADDWGGKGLGYSVKRFAEDPDFKLVTCSL